MIEVTGSCHCGAVQFTVRVPQQITVSRCNCSICSACGFLHYIVPATRFELKRGEDVLTEYRFNTGQARHLFCSRCGVKSFYVPRSNPDGYSLNANCVNWPDTVEIVEENFDGLNWEENAQRLKHFSEDIGGN
jgi:hypothetical protein